MRNYDMDNIKDIRNWFITIASITIVVASLSYQFIFKDLFTSDNSSNSVSYSSNYTPPEEKLAEVVKINNKTYTSAGYNVGNGVVASGQTYVYFDNCILRFDDGSTIKCEDLDSDIDEDYLYEGCIVNTYVYEDGDVEIIEIMED